MTEPRKLKVLFLCTGNACRSQMAEAFAKKLKGDVMEVWSAGVSPAEVSPIAAEVMAEIGYDLSDHRAKHVRKLKKIKFDYVITLCDYALEVCPRFPGQTRVIHHGFDDPPSLAMTARTADEALGHYRRIRDEIKAFVETLPEALNDA